MDMKTGQEGNVAKSNIILDDEEDVKSHTFRKRRLTYTETHLADAINSADLQALDDSDDADQGEKDVTIDNGEVSKKGFVDDAETNVAAAAEATPPKETDNQEEESSNNDNNSQTSNQLESKVLHASAPPIPKDCNKRRGSLLYIHHADPEEETLEGEDGKEYPEQQPLKRSKLDGEHKNHDDDETGSCSSSCEVEWKKKRHSSIHAKDDTLPFPRHIVGTYSCHGIEPVYDETDQHPDSAPFIAKTNQDRGGVAFPYANNSKMAVFAAYDGHGDGGEHVAQYALHEIPRRLELHDDFLKGNFEKAFQEVFVGVDKDLAYENDIEPRYSGCTACVALLNDNVFHLANAGDSRAVMARRTMQDGKIVRRAIDLTIDQNPDSPGEQERIEKMGGFVSPPPEEGLSARVWLDCNHSQIGLAMARSLGDHAVKSIGVIATPVVSTHELTETDDFMIIATDGVWEFMSSQEAVDIVSEHLDSGNGSSFACQNLIESAAGLWHENEGDYRDDITALVVKVQELWK